MAMTDSGLSAAIKAAIIEISGSPSNATELQNFCDALGKAVVEYVKANATVTGIVGSGAGSGGNVTGTVS